MKQKCFWLDSETFSCFQDAKFASATYISRAAKLRSICVGSNVSATMFPSLARPWWSNWRRWEVKTLGNVWDSSPFLKTFHANFPRLTTLLGLRGWSGNRGYTKTANVTLFGIFFYRWDRWKRETLANILQTWIILFLLTFNVPYCPYSEQTHIYTVANLATLQSNLSRDILSLVKIPCLLFWNVFVG